MKETRKLKGEIQKATEELIAITSPVVSLRKPIHILLNHDDDFTAVDIITLASEKIALVIGGDGLYQFDISSPAEPRFLSRIDVNK